MDRMREAVCLAMSIAASMSVIGYRVILLRNLSSFVQGGEPLPINFDLGMGHGERG
jgi:hypothetical protein